MAVKLKGLDAIKRKLRQMRDAPADRQLLEGLGTQLALDIVNETLDGKDASGKVFKPYTKSYAKYRLSKGRSTTVNLSFHGQMLSAINSKVEGSTAVVYFAKSLENVKALGISKKRTFFEVRGKRRKKVLDQVQRYYRAIIRG